MSICEQNSLVNECLVVCLYSGRGTQRELFNKGHTSDLEPHPSREPRLLDPYYINYVAQLRKKYPVNNFCCLKKRTGHD